MYLKAFIIASLVLLASAHEDDTVEDFERLMHESSDSSSIPKEELRARLRRILEDVDEDADGVIEAEELKAWVGEAEEKVTTSEAMKDMTSLDADGDNSVSWDEYVAANGDDSQEELDFAKQLFDIADENDDGELTLEEFIDFSNPEDDDDLRPLMVQRLLKKLDGDGDGKLSYLEVKGLAKSEGVFDEDDENDDGYLDEEEIDEILDDDFEDEEVTALLQKLKAADDDSDGALTIEELLEEEHLLQDTPIMALGLKLYPRAQREEL